jgi:cardiolipin synthase
MLQTINEAETFINVGFYIWRGDAVGWRFAEALSLKSRQGITVRAIYDAVGCIDVSPLIFETMRVEGIEVVEYKPLRPWLPRWGLWRRNHRKLLVVDNKVGYVGGINLTIQYESIEAGGKGWRDTDVRFEGQAVGDLNRLFLNVWERETHPQRQLARPPATVADPPGNQAVGILATDRFQRDIRMSYLHAIRQARYSICIATAYFIPDLRIRNALFKAAKRGVDIRIIIPAKSDVQVVTWAGRYIYGKLLANRIRLFEWQGVMLHCKTAVVDSVWSTVGSSNLDHLSLLSNLEVNVLVMDPSFGAQMKEVFEKDLDQCREYTQKDWKERSWWQRIRSWFFYGFRWIL